MGSSDEDRKPSKTEKSSPPQPEQTGMHMYPDWAAMQAYYGPRMTMPPYFNSAVAPGHPHPYMWGPPQPMMPHYGPHYAAIYSHGGVYTHPAVPLAATTVSAAETPTKSSGNTDRGLIKKLKGFDGLAMSIGNGNTDSAGDGAGQGLSQSGETEGSSDGSDGNTAGAEQSGRKRSRVNSPKIGGVEKTETQISPVTSEDKSDDKSLVLSVPPAIKGKVGGNILSPNMNTTLELKNPPSLNAMTSPTSVPPPAGVLSAEGWMQNERELKREKRKQSNRESARRSRLRKQAETEELALKVESLNTENTALKAEINRLTENSEKLKNENATLLEKLKDAQLGKTEKIVLIKVDDNRNPPVSTENLLSRVNNSGSNEGSLEEESNIYDKNISNSGAKLRQLLPRADAVAAS